MQNFAIFLILSILFYVLARLVLKQYPPLHRRKISHRNRKAIDKNYVYQLDKETQSVIGITFFILIFIFNISTNGFRPLPTYQMRDNSAPSLTDNGPSSDGRTTLTVTNAVPHPFVFKIQQKKQKKEFELDSCQNCKIYANSSEVPEDICKMGTTTTIAATPGENNVYWYYRNATISTINAKWQIEPGRNYSICIITDLSKARTNWDYKTPTKAPEGSSVL